MSFRLKYADGTKYAAMFGGRLRYPDTARPGFATRERAELARLACPSSDEMEVEESD